MKRASKKLRKAAPKKIKTAMKRLKRKYTQDQICGILQKTAIGKAKQGHVPSLKFILERLY
jgi:hypothetical protein